MSIVNRRPKTTYDDYITVAYTTCVKCGEVSAIVIRRDFLKTEANCKYCRIVFTEGNVKKIRVETYSIPNRRRREALRDDQR